MFLSDEMQLLQTFGYQECACPELLSKQRQRFNRLCLIYLVFCGSVTGLVAITPLLLFGFLGGSQIAYLSDSTAFVLSLVWFLIFAAVCFKSSQALWTIKRMGNAAFDLDWEKIHLCKQ